MKKQFTSFLIFSYILISPIFASKLPSLESIEVSPEELVHWTRQVIPLPKEISIKEKVKLLKSDIKVSLLPNPTVLEKHAASKLRELLYDNHKGENKYFEIVLGTCNRDGEIGSIATLRIKATPSSAFWRWRCWSSCRATACIRFWKAWGAWVFSEVCR